MIQTARTLAARALVRIAVAVLPKAQADQLAEASRLIWRPGQPR